jgi:glycosyltransferase involved in cell wall biosynthesis
VVGHNTSSDLSALADDPSVELVGFAEDLGSYYERARIFVAPTRFAAGISLMVYGVAARGIPVVATTLIAEQLGWVNGEDLLSASATEPEEFAEQCVRLYGDKALWSHVRNSALARVQQDCSPQRFEETLRTVIMQPPRTDGADSRNSSMRVVT